MNNPLTKNKTEIDLLLKIRTIELDGEFRNLKVKVVNDWIVDAIKK